MDIEKLERLFSRRYDELCREGLRPLNHGNDFFVDWCDRHKIVMMHNDWVQDEFNKPRRNKVCIMSPEEGRNSCPWLLVPKKFAERALVLGYLP